MHRFMAVIATALFIASAANAQPGPPQPPQPPQPQRYENDVLFPSAAKKAVAGGASCLSQYIPTPATPIATLAVNFHIYQKSDGSGNWQDTPFDREQLEYLVKIANHLFTANPKPSDPCPAAKYTVTDTRIRVVLKNVYFYRDDTLYTATPGPLQARALKDHPAARAQMNVHFNQWPGGQYSGAVNSLPTIDPALEQYMHMPRTYTGGLMAWASAGTFRHELGHAVGLDHTYPPGETCDSSNACEYLSDVFCGVCPHEGGWNCDPNSPLTKCTNNLMGGTQGEGFLSDLQAAKMQRAVQTLSVKRYLDPAGCVAPPPDMLLWLPLDEADGPTALNPLGPAGVRKGAIAVVPDVATRGICFSGTAEASIEVPGHQAININDGPFSIELWVKRTPFDNGARVLVDKSHSSAFFVIRGFLLLLENGYPTLEIWGRVLTKFTATVKVPDDNAYHHVAVTYTRGDDAGLRFYIDGTLAGAPLSTVSATLPIGTMTPLRIGATKAGWMPQMQGCIDEVAFYRRVLQPSEIKALFEARGAGKCRVFGTAPAESVFCRNNTSTKAFVRLCNASVSPRNVAYSFAPVAAGGNCTIAGPATFTPANSSVTIPAGSCVDVSTTIARPAAMTAHGLRSCYRFQATAGSQTFSFQGSLIDLRNDCTNTFGDGVIITPLPR